MKTHHWILFSIIAFAFIFLGFGCGEGDDDDDDQNDNDDDVPNDDNDDNDDTEPDAISSATPGVATATLTETHSGWKKTDCFTCHAEAHDFGFETPQCITCHGDNGAPRRSSGHDNADCSSCHEGQHAQMQFQAPKDCRMCHGYEAPQGNACPSTESFDVVVIGAGGGGLSTAAKLARSGMSVAVLEQHYKVGGCMGTFRRGDYNFEVSLHAMDGLEPPDGMNLKMFEELGIADKVARVKLDPMYVSTFPGLTLEIPADFETYRQLLMTTFPEQADSVNRLFDDMKAYDKVFNAIYSLQDGMNLQAIWTILSNLGTTLKFAAYLNKTVSELLAEYNFDDRFVSVWTQLALFLGVEPSRLSAMMFIVMWNNYHLHGFYYFEGGSGAVADALAEVVEENGGTVRTGARATKIDIENGRAVRVRTQDDGCYEGRYIVSNANAIDTLENMVGEQYLPPDYLAALDNMDIGLSVFVVYLGVDHDFGEIFGNSHEIMFSSTFDTDENMDYIRSGDLDHAPGAIANYSAVDPTAAPAGKSSMQVISQLPYDWRDNWAWDQGYDAYVKLKTEAAWKLIERAENYLPGLTDHIEVMEVGTPRTVQNYTLNPLGTIFGWDHTIDQSLDRRLQNQTPIENLYLAGAWTMPGAGQSAVLQSGILVSDMILEAEGR